MAQFCAENCGAMELQALLLLVSVHLCQSQFNGFFRSLFGAEDNRIGENAEVLEEYDFVVIGAGKLF